MSFLRTIIEKAGNVIGTRRRLNFIEGSNVTLTIVDDSANDEIDITIASTGGGGAVWGSITGTLSSQTDLQTALDNKLDDTQFSGVAKISVGTTTPVGPATGDLWVDTN
jgi:hypothetical protein